MNCYYPRRGVRNKHRMALMQHFGEPSAFPVELPDKKAFLFLCYTNRCGSNHLADLLRSTKRFRFAGEYFNDDVVISHARTQGHCNLQDYFLWLVRHRSTARGLVTCKLAIPHLELLGDAGLLEPAISRGTFVFMTRQDRLGQAISREIAEQNKRWTSKTTGVLPDDALVFSRLRLKMQMNAIHEENQEFETFFAANGIDPVRVQYERLVENPQEALETIGTRLRFQTRLQAAPERLTLSKQRSSLNDEWRERYLAAPSVQGSMERLWNLFRP